MCFGVYNLSDYIKKKKNKYYVFDKDGKILIITSYKRIAENIDRKNNGKKSNRKATKVP